MGLKKRLICIIAVCIMMIIPALLLAQESKMQTETQENANIPYEEFTLDNGLRVFC